MRELRYTFAPLDTSFPLRPLSPGASLSATDVSMATSISWEADRIPERPRSAQQQLRRQPSISESIRAQPNPSSLPEDIWRVHHSHYVAFSLDMAAIASTTEDPVKREALMQLQPRRYVGLVVWSGMEPEYAEGAEEGDPPERHTEVLAPLFVGRHPPPFPQARHMCLPIDPSPPSGANGQDPSIAVADDDAMMTEDGVFDMDDEFQGQDQDFHEAMDQDCNQAEQETDMARFGPLTAINHPSLLPLKGHFQWLPFGTRLLITTLHESSLRFYIDDDEDKPPYEWRRLEALVTAHIGALSDLPPDAEDDAALLGKLAVPDIALPAIVWRDIRGEHEDDPTEFVREVDRISAILGEPLQ